MDNWLKTYKNLSLRRKLLIFTMAIVLFIGGSMGILIRLIIFPHLTREMEGRGIGAAHRLGESSRTFILGRDKARLTASLFDEKQLEKNIAYIIVSDADGGTLAHTFIETPVPPMLQSTSGDRVLTTGDSAEHIRSGTVSEIVVPVYEGVYQIGTIRVGLDERFINDLIQRLSLYHLGFVALVTVAGLIFGLYLSRAITAPIGVLTKLAAEISLGNLSTRINLGDQKQCWEILQCQDMKCPAHETEERRCWFIDGTPCERASDQPFPQKLDYCKSCPVYHSQAGDEIVQLADTFNHMTVRLRESEARLRRSEERYRLLFNIDPSPVIAIELDTQTILDANDRAVENFGLSRESLLGMKFSDLGFKEDSIRIAEAFLTTAHEGKACSMVPRVCRRVGNATFWDSIAFCHYPYMGKPCVIARITDITEIIETEAKLIQAGKMTTLGEMSAGIAHELNQPLNAIKLGGEYLQTMIAGHMPIPDEDLQEVSSHITKEVDRASHIINHLREFGRKSTVARERIDINTPIRGVFTMLGQQLKVHDIDVVLDLAESLPPVLADGNRIEQVLINLVLNGRDAIEAKRTMGSMETVGKLTVKSFLDNGQVVITVSDTGEGVPESLRDRLFEPFFTTKEVGKGTGLGLSVSYGIVRDYGGTIDFESWEGIGTTFRVCFPPVSSGE